MRISNVLLVGIESPSLAKQLERFGYGVISAPDIESILGIEAPYSLMVIDERCISGMGTDAVERLYFLNNSVPTAVLMNDPRAVNESLHRMVCEGTFEPVYAHEIESGFICAKIDRIFITSQFNKNIRLHQQTFHEKEMLKRELSMREQVLKQERLINTNIIGSITAGLIIIDTQGNIILVNEHAHQLLAVGDCIGAAAADVLPAEVVAAARELTGKQDTNRPHTIRKCMIRDRFIETSAFRMNDYENKPSGILLIVHDITDQEQTSVQLFRAEKLATVGTMLSGIAHELRNPLAIISARAQRTLAVDNADTGRIRKSFESIETQAKRCASIVNNLLDFTRQTATKTGYHKAADVLDETLAYIDFQNLFDNIAVVKRYEPDLSIFGDRSRFVQVFLNLLTNAAEAMEGSGTLTITTSAAGPFHTTIEINDTGPGIPPEINSKIFDPFFTTKEPGKGTGLGLAIAFKIIQQSAGAIRFVSRPGSTSFFVRLPSVKERSDE